MTLKEKIKRFALKHEKLIAAYRSTFGKIKTKYYFNAQKKALQKNGMKLIGKIDKALTEAGGKYIVHGGSLLGLIRDGELIKHDMDIDFGIFFDADFTKEDLDKAMLAIGLKKHRSFYYRDDPAEVSYSFGITDIDFFHIYENGDSMNSYYFHRDVSKDYPSDDCFDANKLILKKITDIKRMTVQGYSFNVPENAEEYLEVIYGKTWRTPDLQWKATDVPCLHSLDGEYGILK